MTNTSSMLRTGLNTPQALPIICNALTGGSFFSKSESPVYGISNDHGTQGQNISLSFFVSDCNGQLGIFVGAPQVKKAPNKPTWKTLAETGLHELSVLEVKCIIEDLGSFLSRNNFTQINFELQTLDTSRLGEDAIVAVTRTLAPVSEKLPFWETFIDRLHSILKERSINPIILRGLI